MRKFWLFLLLLFMGSGGTAWAACSGSSPNWTVNVAGDGYTAAAINACITAASAGDTVNVPAGTYNLEAAITLNKNIHLKGAGSNLSIQTLLKQYGISMSAVASGGYYPQVSGMAFYEFDVLGTVQTMGLTLSAAGPVGTSITATAASGTPFAGTVTGKIIQVANAGRALIAAKTSDTVVTATIGVEFASASISGSGWYLGSPTLSYNIYTASGSTQFRIWNNYFHGTYFNTSHRWIGAGGAGASDLPTYGLIDNNYFYGRESKGGILVRGTGTYPPGISRPASLNHDGFGTAKAVYIEDNTVLFDTAVEGRPILDSDYGGSYVQRFNTMTNALGGAHGPGDYNVSDREGALLVEQYENTSTWLSPTFAYWGFQMRGGSGVWFNNTITLDNAYMNAPMRDIVYRAETASCTDATYSCDGDHAWDGNTVYVQASSSGGDTDTMTTNAVLAEGAHIGRRLFDVATGSSCLIASNTSTTVECASAMENSFSWSTGRTFEIRTGWPCYEQFGTLASATGAYGATGWKFDRVPAYLWNNSCATINGGSWSSSSNCPSGKMIMLHYSGYSSCRVRVPTSVGNRDYYESRTLSEQTAQGIPFTGAFTTETDPAVGYGTIARRPATCTVGAGYWATDEGVWNAKHAGPDGQLYKCTATNTWTLYYTPYQYPHPLQSYAPPSGGTLTLGGSGTMTPGAGGTITLE